MRKLFGDIQTDYLDGFQHKLTKPSEAVWDEGMVIKDPNEVAIMKLRIIPTSEGYYDALMNQYIYNFTDHLGNVRLSYTDTNKDGVIQPRRYHWQQCDPVSGPLGVPNCIDGWSPGEIVEVNNYYPFGLLHNYTMTTQNAYQYKYNGKELQETGMYDYGARFYMPDLGRWGVIDNYSESYNSLSPYNYVAGNPIKYIDINGEWIYINDQNGTRYRYHNGATQHQVNGKWTNIDNSINLSDYVVQAVASLNYLDSLTSIGKEMINYFDQGEGKDGKTRDIHFNYTTGGSQVRHGISNIVDLNANDKKGVWTTAGRDIKNSPLYTTVAHEMGHVYGYFALGQVAQSDSRFGTDSTTAEIYGTHVENIVRAETGLPLRTHYGSDCIGSKCIPKAEGRIIDNIGNSIYYNSGGTQITPIPNVRDVLNVNNTILQNRYNYHGAALLYRLQKTKIRPR